ncbi:MULTISPECIES: hypothetical protein [Actinoallomurus]|jgi:hypothetical protein|uniref:SPOR domain-containing protein n=1 Tax=Actinoallomurus spadix TaxID=79912 RepID=A0ABP3H048_9ACTN|nr:MULTISPECIES: hypothetical protein [Actinoallomurus]MCO5967003.1 hypothetical protein [Actinoallomurus soli]MCO5991008.1 hypothetical protein [Actinoallomurus spadix]MCO5996416.1 hypothetical protein [Actinoallomurus rhizosphaericola]
MSDEGKWFFCLKHQRVEHGPGCPDRDRMGPYASEDEAAHALQRAAERNEQWRRQDDDF